MYNKYFEGAAQPATPRSAQSGNTVAGLASRRVAAVHGSRRGYTIIEVMIVLAISGALLASSVAIFRGQQAETEFSQSLLDMQSKFQSYGTEVSSANLPSGYTCALQQDGSTGANYPALTLNATQTSDSTSNQDCLFLGRAIQIIPGTDTIYVYPVLGTRTIWNGTSDTGQFPATPAQANPEPALDTNGNYVLGQFYTLLNGSKIVSAKVSGSTTEQDLLMFYSNLQDANTSGAEATAYTRDYSFVPADVNSARLRSCIEGGTCGANPATKLGSASWQLCITSSDGSRSSQLNIQNSPTGFTTKTQEGCS